MLAVLVWALIAMLMISLALTRRLIITTVYIGLFILAYGQQMGDALIEGQVINGVGVSGRWILSALLALVLYLGVVLATALAVQRSLARFSERRTPPSQRWLTAIDVAFLALLIATAVAAWSSETQSYWGNHTGVGSRDLIRLELLYPALLVGIILHLIVTRGYGGFLDRSPRIRWLVGGVVLLLLFILQSRRLMIGGVMLVAVAWLVSARWSDTQLRGRLYRAAMLIGVVGFFILGSFGWRSSSLSDTDGGLISRLESALGSLGSDEGLIQFQSRLTYLWCDGVAQELHARHGARLDAVELFESDVARAVPRLILPSKDDVTPVTCESALREYGVLGDLPCTPMAEGFLVAGFGGVLLAGLLWGLFIGVCDLAIGRGPGLVAVFSVLSVVPMLFLESGFFGFIDAIRSGLIGSLFVAAGALVVIALSRWSRE